MNEFRGFYSFVAFLTIQLNLFADSPINAPLNEEDWKIAWKMMPILVAPDFSEGRDNLIAFDYDTRILENGEPVGSVSTSDNKTHNALIKTKKVPALLDFDFFHNGGAYTLSVLFFRPESEMPLIPRLFSLRSMDSEGALIIRKKDRIGVEYSNPASQGVVIGNAHGDMSTSACSKDNLNCLIPNFVADSKVLSNYLIEQAANRVVEELDGRIVLISEPGTHANVPMSDSKKLTAAIDMKKAVVYYPEGADLTETKKRLTTSATYIPYLFRRPDTNSVPTELSSVVIANKNKNLMTGRELQPLVTDDWWNRKVKLVGGIKSEFVDEKNKPSGANPYFGWGITSCEKDGKRFEPKERGSNTRIDACNTHLILEKSLFGFFSQDEIQQGALKPIRNPWMTFEQ